MKNYKYKWNRLSAAVIIRAHKLMRRKIHRIQCREWYVRIVGLDGRYISTCRIRGKKRRILFFSRHELGLFTEVRYNV